MIRLIVCGPKYFTDAMSLVETLDSLLANAKSKPEILTRGNYGGVDDGADFYAFKRGLTNKRFHLSGRWEEMKRIEEMVESANALLALDDGELDRETKALIRAAKENGLKVKVIEI